MLGGEHEQAHGITKTSSRAALWSSNRILRDKTRSKRTKKTDPTDQKTRSNGPNQGGTA